MGVGGATRPRKPAVESRGRSLYIGPVSVLSSPNERRVVLATSTATAMGFVDMTAVNTALPVIQRQLGASITDAQWIVEVYMLFLASVILVGGALGDTLGRRRVFRWGVAGFGVTSLICALTSTTETLIAARAAQGLASALMIPSSLALLNASYPPAKRGRAVGLWVTVTSFAVPLGPLLGGGLTDLVGWPWIFIINLPLCLVAYWAVLGVERPHWDPPEGAPMDIPGAVLATVGLGGLTFAGLEAPRLGFDDPLVFAAFAVGVSALVIFVWVENRVTAPMLPLHLFRHKTFGGINLQTFLFFGGFQGATFFIPFMFIQAREFSAFQAGMTLLPLSLFIAGLSRTAGWFTDRIGRKPPLLAGPVIASAGVAAIGLAPPEAGYWEGYFPWICLMSFGIGMTIVPLTATAMNAAGEGRSGLAAGVNNTVARAGQLIAVAVLGMALVPAFETSLRAGLAASTLSGDLRLRIMEQSIRLTEIDLPAGLSDATRSAAETVIRNAFFDGFMMCMAMGAVLLALSSLTAVVAVGHRD